MSDRKSVVFLVQAEVAQREKKHGIAGHFSIVQLHIIVLVFVLISSGLISVEDLGFVAFASLYFVAMRKFVFPSMSTPPASSVFAGNRLLGRYVAFAGVIGLLLPVAYILGSFVQGDQKALKAASPHLFLLACQVLTENASVKFKGTSLPVRALVPIFYNTRRLFSLASWLKSDLSKGLESVGLHGMDAPIGASQWILFGRGLAAANMAIWSFNLFCFLLPVYLPRVMRKHFEMERAAKVHHT